MGVSGLVGVKTRGGSGWGLGGISSVRGCGGEMVCCVVCESDEHARDEGCDGGVVLRWVLLGVERLEGRSCWGVCGIGEGYWWTLGGDLGSGEGGLE